MHITRVVTTIDENTSEIRFRLNGHLIWVGKNTCRFGVMDSPMEFSSKWHHLVMAIVRDKPGVNVDLADPDIIHFLKRTECLP